LTLRDDLQRTHGTGFRVDRELTGGGMATVFLATDLALDRPVVKLLRWTGSPALSG
jgi:hypothetical protein